MSRTLYIRTGLSYGGDERWWLPDRFWKRVRDRVKGTSRFLTLSTWKNRAPHAELGRLGARQMLGRGMIQSSGVAVLSLSCVCKSPQEDSEEVGVRVHGSGGHVSRWSLACRHTSF